MNAVGNELPPASAQSSRREAILQRYRELVRQRNEVSRGNIKRDEIPTTDQSRLNECSEGRGSSKQNGHKTNEENNHDKENCRPKNGNTTSFNSVVDSTLSFSKDAIDPPKLDLNVDFVRENEVSENISDDDSSLWAMVGDMANDTSRIIKKNNELANDTKQPLINGAGDSHSGILGEVFLDNHDVTEGKKMAQSPSFLDSITVSRMSEVKLGIELGLENVFDAEMTRIECDDSVEQNKKMKEEMEAGIKSPVVNHAKITCDKTREGFSDLNVDTPREKSVPSSLRKSVAKPKSVAFSPFSHIISDDECDGESFDNDTNNELDSLDGKDFSISFNQGNISPMTPFSTTKRDSIESALEESQMYMEKIETLATNLKLDEAEDKSDKKQVDHEKRIEELVIQNRLALSEIMSLKKSFLNESCDRDPLNQSIVVSPNGTDERAAAETATASLIERNKTLVKEIRFADQTCVELSERNVALENEIARLQKELSCSKKENESMHDAVVRSAKHGAKMEAKLDVIVTKDIEQKSRFDMQLDAVSSALEDSRKEVAFLKVQIERYETLSSKHENLVKEEAESKRLLACIMERLTDLKHNADKSDELKLLFHDKRHVNIHDQLEELKKQFDSRFDSLFNERKKYLYVNSEHKNLKHRCRDLKNRLGHEDCAAAHIHGEANACDKEVNTSCIVQPVTTHPLTSQVLAKTLQYELKRGHSITDRVVQAEKALVTMEIKLESLTNELHISKEDGKVAREALEKIITEKDDLVANVEYWEDKSRQLEKSLIMHKESANKSAEKKIKCELDEVTKEYQEAKSDFESTIKELQDVSYQLEHALEEKKQLMKKISSYELSHKELEIRVENSQKETQKYMKLYESSCCELKQVNGKLYHFTMQSHAHQDMIMAAKKGCLDAFLKVDEGHRATSTLVDNKINDANERIRKLTKLILVLTQMFKSRQHSTLSDYINDTKLAGGDVSTEMLGNVLFDGSDGASSLHGTPCSLNTRTGIELLNETFGIDEDSKDSLGLIDLDSPLGQLEESRINATEKSHRTPKSASKMNKLKCKLQNSVNRINKARTDNLALFDMLDTANSEIDDLKNSIVSLKEKHSDEKRELIESISQLEAELKKFKHDSSRSLTDGKPSDVHDKQETLNQEIMDLNIELSSYQMRLRNLQGEIYRLREEASEITKNHQIEIDALNAELSKLQSEGEECISELEKEIGSANKMRDEAVSVQRQLHDLKGENCDLRNNLEEYESSIATARSRIRELEEELLSAVEKQNELFESCQKRESKYIVLEKKLEDSPQTSEVDNLKLALQEAHNLITEKTNELSASINESKNLRTQLRLSQENITRCENRCNELENTNTKLSSDNLRYEAHITEVTDTLKERMGELDTLKETNSTFKEMLQKASRKNTSNEENIRNLRASLKSTSEQMAEAQTCISTDSKEREQLAIELKQYFTEQKDLVTQLEQERERVQNLEERLKETSTQLTMSLSEKSEVDKALREHEKHIDILEEKLQMTVEDNEHMKTEYQAITARNDALQVEVLQRKNIKMKEYTTKLTKKCEEWAEGYKSLSKDISRIKQERNSAMKKSTDFKGRVDLLIAEIKSDRKIHIRERETWSKEREYLERKARHLEQEVEYCKANLESGRRECLEDPCRECRYLRKAVTTETQRNSILREELVRRDADYNELNRRINMIHYKNKAAKERTEKTRVRNVTNEKEKSHESSSTVAEMCSETSWESLQPRKLTDAKNNTLKNEVVLKESKQMFRIVNRDSNAN